MSEKLQSKALNVGKVAKRKSPSPAPSAKNSLTCSFANLKMSPNNKLQLFRHFPIQQLLLRPPAQSSSTHTNNNAPSGPNAHFPAFSTTLTPGSIIAPGAITAPSAELSVRHRGVSSTTPTPGAITARGAITAPHPRPAPSPHHTQTRRQHHTQCRAARTPPGSFPHLELLHLWINRSFAESYPQGQATHIPPSSFNCENGREPGCVAESLYLQHIS